MNAMQIDTCPVCKEPCHATEGDELGRHPKCQTAPKLTEAQRRIMLRIKAGLPLSAREVLAAGTIVRKGLLAYGESLADLKFTDAGRAALKENK